jgi:hypothetical protein
MEEAWEEEKSNGGAAGDSYMHLKTVLEDDARG